MTFSPSTLTIVTSATAAILGIVLWTKLKPSTGLGSHSSALDVVHKFGDGNYLLGKTAIVTGGNSGIGLETCKALASAGCRVILCSRSLHAGEKAIEEEIKNPGNGNYVVQDTSNIVVKELDLSELSSIKKFCNDILSQEKRIDFLILNAGIMALPNLEYTSSGFERQIGVNHFGHAYLYFLLEDFIKSQNHPCRAVFLASSAHNIGIIDMKNLHFQNGRFYSDWIAYGQSKLANILFAKAVADHAKGTNLTAFSVHPGIIKTNLYRTTSNWLVGMASFIMDKNIPQGAATTLYGCLAPELGSGNLSGSYLADCSVASPSWQAQDRNGTLRQSLWEVTKQQLEEATKNL